MRGMEHRVKKGRQTRAPTLLVVSDCLGVLVAIEKAWRSGTAWGLHKGGRRSILENILLKRSDWAKRGGALVIIWTPSHSGVFMNGYADMGAKAYLGQEVRERTRDRPVVESTLIQYSVHMGDGTYSWMEGERKLIDLGRRQIGEHMRRQAT